MFAIESVLQPPGSILVLLVATLSFFKRFPRFAKLLLLVSILSLYFVSTKVGVWVLYNTLLEPAEMVTSVDKTLNDGQTAIVILGAGRYYNAQEYGGDTLSSSALVRARYAAKLARETRLPILASGGADVPAALTEAQIMDNALKQEYHLPVRWQENRSRNTYENAKFSSEILKKEGYKRVVIVTHAIHMQRAEEVFRYFGLEVIPAPTRLLNEPYFSAYYAWTPRASELENAASILHEWLGRMFYHLRYNIPLS